MWEACMTLNGSWFWNSHDRFWKSSSEIIGYLIMCANGGGNFLLDIGPKADSSIPDPAVKRLKEIGQWLKNNGESIYGSKRSPFMWQSCGLTTVKGNHIYFHPGLVTATNFNLDARAWKQVSIGGIKNRLRTATDVATNKKLDFIQQNDRIILKNLPTERKGTCNNAIRLDVTGIPQYC
jgi:alpha-L-fucosidase